MSGVSTDATEGGSPRARPVPPLVVELSGSRWRLPAGGTYTVGRDPGCAVVVPDARVSRRHAVLRVDDGRWQIVDNGSANGVFVGSGRVERGEIAGECLVRLADAESGPILRLVAEGEPEEPTVRFAPRPERGGSAAGPPPREIPYAVRWLVPNGERYANFDVLNDNDSQLEYFRRFGHVYAVGVPTKPWRLVVVSDPELLEHVAMDEAQFGKRVEGINFFSQLTNSRGGGLSVIGDGEHYEQVRRVMLPWYSPTHQRTQLELMKEQARKLVRAWTELPDEEPLEARGWMERYTLEVSGRGACAYDFGLLGDGDGAAPHAFAAAVPASTKESIRRVADPRPDAAVLAGPAARARRKAYRRHNAELFRTADALVQARRHTCPAGQPVDLLSRLVSTPDPETGALLDDETVRDQVLMHLSNGFNGPSITAAWLVAVLATHPDVEARLIAEIDGVTGGDPEYDLRYDDLARLTYTTQVIKEALRVYPPMPITIRRSLKDGLLGPYRVRKGDVILVGALAAQRDPRFWGPQPERFDPDHFTPERIAARPLLAFIPFSIGRRQCMAQEVTFMMLRVLLFELYRRFRLRLAPGTTVAKNTVVTTKPEAVRVTRIPRLGAVAPAATAVEQPPPERAAGPGWGKPTDVPSTSAYRHLVIAYGSNFGASKDLAERFAERGDFHGYTTEVLTLDELAKAPARTEPWLLVVMTSTYTGNPPSNATAFRAWVESAKPGSAHWRGCRYLVWGLGNRQWNAFLAFPRYVHRKLAELGATPHTDLDFADVGEAAWESRHEEWNRRVWPALLDLSGAKPTRAAAARVALDDSVTTELTGADSVTAMRRSLHPADGGDHAAPPDVLVPSVFDSPAGVATVEARVLAARELLPSTASRRTRHLELALPAGVRYRTGDHLGVCPRNDAEDVERLARHLGVALDGLFTVPKALPVRAVPKGVVLQVRNVLTNLVDIGGKPTVALVDALLRSATDADEKCGLAQIGEVLRTPRGPASALRAAVDAGAYDVLRLLDAFPSCSLNVFELLCVAQPLRPRYYSVSSCPEVHGACVAHLTVGIDSAPVPGDTDRTFSGTGSGYLHRLRPGDRLAVFLDSADGFHLQDDLGAPMIFVSAGTGFAPMRAFLWERLAARRNGVALGEAALFNGLRSRGFDQLYREEVDRFVADGVLEHVHLAASREQPGREHVQDRLRREGELVWRLLSEGAHAYVCGARPMRDAVRAAFVDVVARHAPMPRGDAEAFVTELETGGRYRPDVWA